MSHVLVIGATPARRLLAALTRTSSTRTVVVDPAVLPFTRVEEIQLPPSPFRIVLDGIERAFPDAQSGGTRLVLTQSSYLLQKWFDRLDDADHIVATADRGALAHRAPEALLRGGRWQQFEIVDLDDALASDAGGEEALPVPSRSHASAEALSVEDVTVTSSATPLLVRAFTARDPAERLHLCHEAVSLAPSSAVAHLALGSACREARDGIGARSALERAASLAPDWEAVPYERGKLSLVYDDIASARDAFRRAAELMPSFSAAWSNLGATLGELGDPEAALDAFRQALAHDPHSVTTLNNIGVVSRELAQLDESESALRRAIALNPAFTFGHYNLGHTLFLAGRYPESVKAYEEGRHRDPQQNRRQGCRLALARLGDGDAAGAERELWACVNAAPAEEREDLLLEAYEVARALLMQNPALEPHRPLLDRLGAEITKSE